MRSKSLPRLEHPKREISVQTPLKPLTLLPKTLNPKAPEPKPLTLLHPTKHYYIHPPEVPKPEP